MPRVSVFTDGLDTYGTPRYGKGTGKGKGGRSTVSYGEQGEDKHRNPYFDDKKGQSRYTSGRGARFDEFDGRDFGKGWAPTSNGYNSGRGARFGGSDGSFFANGRNMERDHMTHDNGRQHETDQRGQRHPEDPAFWNNTLENKRLDALQHRGRREEIVILRNDNRLLLAAAQTLACSLSKNFS